ncbi:MAG: hypothetical protein WAW61_06940 [Methylococcaceae bacterium]
MALFGVPPEKYWPYNIADFDVEPSAFLYAFAQSYQAINYYRLDPPYEYVLNGLAVDWWTLIKHEYIETNKFGFYILYSSTWLGSGSLFFYAIPIF